MKIHKLCGKWFQLLDNRYNQLFRTCLVFLLGRDRRDEENCEEVDRPDLACHKDPTELIEAWWRSDSRNIIRVGSVALVMLEGA